MYRHRKIVKSAILSGMACAASFVATSVGANQIRQADHGFYLRNDDRVVFYGDSITEQHLYTTYIETFCVTRFPNYHLTFINSGWGGDRVTGGGGGPIDTRLQRDVIVYKPTVVTICLGMNDGGYRPFDRALFDTYVSGYRHILDTLLKALPGVRITLITAPAYDDVTRVAGFPGGYNSVLVAYGEAVKRLGREYGLVVADTNAPLEATLSEAEAANPAAAATLIPDRVHPRPGGHMVMAAAVLCAWKAPGTVADITLDARDATTNRGVGARLSKLQATARSVRFVETDSALPWPLDRDPAQNPEMALGLGLTTYEHDLDRYSLRVTSLDPGAYRLEVDGRSVGSYSTEQLAHGIDLASLASLPANEQAARVLSLAREHNGLHFRRWRQVQLGDLPAGQTEADRQRNEIGLDTQAARAEQRERDASRPVPHSIAIVPDTP